MQLESLVSRRIRVASATIGVCGLLGVSMSGCQVQTSDAVTTAQLPAQTLVLPEPPPTAPPVALEFPEEPKIKKTTKKSRKDVGGGSSSDANDEGAEAPPPPAKSDVAAPLQPKPAKPTGKPVCSGVQEYLYAEANIGIDSARLTIKKANKEIAAAQQNLEKATKTDNEQIILNATLRIDQWRLLKRPAKSDLEVQRKMVQKIKRVCNP